MKNIIEIFSSILLSLIYVVFGLNFFFKFIPIPPSDSGSQASFFMTAMTLTGFLTLIKIYLRLLNCIQTLFFKNYNQYE